MSGGRPRTVRSGETGPDPAAPDEEGAPTEPGTAAALGTPGAERPGGERYPSESRIRHTKEIRGLLRRGKRKRTSHLDVFLASSPVSRSRLGLVVPKHRHTVVERNRLKRRLREIGRRELLPAMTDAGVSVDLLIRTRPEAYEATFQELRAQLAELAETLCSDGPSWG